MIRGEENTHGHRGKKENADDDQRDDQYDLQGEQRSDLLAMSEHGMFTGTHRCILK